MQHFVMKFGIIGLDSKHMNRGPLCAGSPIRYSREFVDNVRTRDDSGERRK